MELTEAIRTRRSVRQYAPTSVDRSVIERLLVAATQAPSAMNSQPWAFGIIEGTDVLREYSERVRMVCLGVASESGSPIACYRAMLSNPSFNVFYGAPILVCIYATPAVQPFALNDCALAAQNLMLAAHDMGLGTCWIGFAQWLFKKPELNRELGIPEEYQAVGQLAVGYPAEGVHATISRRPPEILFWKQGSSIQEVGDRWAMGGESWASPSTWQR